MFCRICGKKSDSSRLCPQCEYFVRHGADEETIKRLYSDDETKKVWKANELLAEELADAYYESTIENYKGKRTSESSKEEFGYNTFIDGIRLGLDTVMPLLSEETQEEVKKNLRQMIIMRNKKNKEVGRQ